MERALSGVQFTILSDRDDASYKEVRDWNAQGVRVLSQRTIESHLWDDEILERLSVGLNQPDKVSEVLALKQREMDKGRKRGNPIDDVKSAAGNIFAELRGILNIRGLGSTREAFSRDTLAPLITPVRTPIKYLNRIFLEMS
jgi:hypothetical protein